ncbi:GNAT family N-acetyltransferase [Streptomyces sp. NBC_00080]|uniref:GNAT family N-acetyltransferase n=1 Tax=Streptomyces sp. NBC_00080 TaxID=2975645 RepID=UPI00324FBC41
MLRPFAIADVDALTAALQDDEIARWTLTPVPFHREHAVFFVEAAYPDGWREDRMYMFGAFTRQGAHLVGAVGLSVRGVGVCEIGCWVAAEHRGNGYAAEALRAALRWAFGYLVASRVEWLAITGNDDSTKLATRLGFRFEGVLRSRIDQRGFHRDAWLAGLLPADLAAADTANDER